MKKQQKTKAKETKIKKILIIDDDEMVLRITSKYLEMLGAPSITSSKPKEGLLLWEKNKSDIVGVILDRNMPGMSGDDVLERMHAENPNIMAVFQTGRITKLNPKAKATFQKPLNKKDFEKIKKIFY